MLKVAKAGHKGSKEKFVVSNVGEDGKVLIREQDGMRDMRDVQRRYVGHGKVVWSCACGARTPDFECEHIRAVKAMIAQERQVTARIRAKAPELVKPEVFKPVLE